MKFTNSTKNLFSIGALIGMILLSIASNDSENPQDNPGNKSALTEIRKEPKVKEAIITDANVFYVSVQDDGTRRDGYAQYLCEILREKNASSKVVKVVKVGSTNDPNKDNAYGVLLGQSDCN